MSIDNSLKPNKKDFEKFFTTQGLLPCIHAEFLMRGSLGKADMFVTGNKTEFNTFLRRTKMQLCLEEGVKIFGDTKRYKLFLKEFQDYLDEANKVIIPRFKDVPEDLTKKELENYLSFVGKFWYLYGFTEFPYLDLAFKKSVEQKNKEMADNLDEFSKFKFTAREVLNAYFFRNGVNENILKFVSQKFSINAKCLFTNEILKLYDGERVPDSVVEQRADCYACGNINGEIVVFPYKEAVELNKEFVEEMVLSDEIKGIPVSPGVARGKAVVSPMLNDHAEIRKIDKIMKKGDILIAETTSPDTLMLCAKASAIVAEQGGLLSHAAVVSREMGIPGIVQATNATRIIKTGDEVEVDADRGIVRILKKHGK